MNIGNCSSIYKDLVRFLAIHAESKAIPCLWGTTLIIIYST